MPSVAKSMVLSPGIAAWVDPAEGRQIHPDVQCQTMVGTVPRDLDAERRDLAESIERPRGGDSEAFARRNRLQRGMSERILETDIDAWRTRNPVTGHPEGLERAKHAMLQPIDVLLDEDAQPAQIDERIGDDLPRTVIGDLAAAVGADQWNVRALAQQVLWFAGNPLREHWRMLADPDLVSGALAPGRIECTHRIVDRPIVDPTQQAYFAPRQAQELTARP